jgi:hypothetical protein
MLERDLGKRAGLGLGKGKGKKKRRATRVGMGNEDDYDDEAYDSEEGYSEVDELPIGEEYYDEEDEEEGESDLEDDDASID